MGRTCNRPQRTLRPQPSHGRAQAIFQRRRQRPAASQRQRTRKNGPHNNATTACPALHVLKQTRRNVLVF